MPFTLLSNQRVAIFEDSPRNRDRLSDLIKINGGIPVAAHPRAPEFNYFDEFLNSEKIEMLVSDHRLSEHGNYATYTGAQAIAEGYKSGRGGVLITSYENEDIEFTIRQFRRWIPSLIHSKELNPETLATALLEADREVRQKIPAKNRLPFRTLMTIVSVDARGPEKIVKVIMSQWNINEEVGFPLHLVPKKMQVFVKPDNMLLAQVNIEANKAEELYFDKFELPDNEVLRKSKSYFNHP
ncbi:MAG: hypothetical protein JXA54_01105 [Candidatus Heimdallarchaeota archaeon]|nr:hypothetical protein [Candidatus Heimdallarchaeota archaeon]